MNLKVFANPENTKNIEAEVSGAGKGSSVFLLCAVAVLPIPVVHLFGVPISLLLAGFTGIRRSHCSHCRTQFLVKP